MRATPRYRSLLEMTPCDLWRSFRGRTLWLVGDSQAQRYHKTLSCLTRPFWLPKEYWPEKEWRPEGQRLSSDTACSKARQAVWGQTGQRQQQRQQTCLFGSLRMPMLTPVRPRAVPTAAAALQEIHGAILQHNTCCGVEHPICTRLLGGTMVRGRRWAGLQAWAHRRVVFNQR